MLKLWTVSCNEAVRCERVQMLSPRSLLCITSSLAEAEVSCAIPSIPSYMERACWPCFSQQQQRAKTNGQLLVALELA